MKKLVFGLLALVILVGMIGAQCPPTASPTAVPPATTKPGDTPVPPKPTAVPPTAVPAKPTYLNMNHGTEPPTIDPNLATDTTSTQSTHLLFMGLTNFDEKTMEVIPSLATKWSVSSDGLKWTFNLRKDVNWVKMDASGKPVKQRPVTAQDEVYSIKRALDPATASDYAYVLYSIKGAEEFNTATVTDSAKFKDAVGVKAVDDYTVEFELKQPAGFFPGIAGLWTANPVPKEAIEAGKDKWTEPANIWTCGPYMLKTWEHDNKMVMVKNPDWFDAKNVQIETINWYMVVEASTAMAMYENGELDVTAPPSADLDRVKADPVLSKEYFQAPVLCTYYLGFNTTKKPVDNKILRQAMSYAVDRKTLCDSVLKGGQIPATTFACPGIFGSPALDPAFQGISFNPTKAKELLAQSGFKPGDMKITYMFNTSEGHKQIAEFVQANWKEYLGLDVELANQEWKVYLKTVNTDAPPVFRMGWCADYADENNWVLENFHSTKSTNAIKWNNPEFDQLVEQAAAESDPAKRKEMYYKAEKILCVDEVAIIPLYYYTRNTLTKPYVTRTYAPLGGENIQYWKVNRK